MSYPSDLKDDEWKLIEKFFVYGNGYGNRRKHSQRTILNAIFYVVKSGCQWRMLPKSFPLWTTVYTYYSRLCKRGIWEKVLDKLNQLNRVKKGKKKEPTYALIDSQSVKTVYKGNKRGFDGGKKNKGKKETHYH